MNLNLEEALKERTIRLTENVTISGDVDFGGRLIIQEHAPRGPLITTQGPTRIRNAAIWCGTKYDQRGDRPTAIRADHQLVLENVRLENLVGWGVEFVGAHSGSRFRDCHFQYENVDQALGQGHCGIFAGGYNVEDLAVINCSFDGADVADNFVWLSKGGIFRIEGCKIENFTLEAICLNAGPGWIERNWFRGRKATASACAALLWVDALNSKRGPAHYCLEPRFWFHGNEVSGCPTMVNAGRPDDAHKPMPMEVSIKDNGFTVDKDAILVANCRRADVSGNSGIANGVFVRTLSMTGGLPNENVSVVGNSAETLGSFLEVSQEISGLLRVEGNNADIPVDPPPHLRLVKPRGHYTVQLHGNRGFRNGKLSKFLIHEIRFPQSVGELDYSPDVLSESAEHKVIDYT